MVPGREGFVKRHWNTKHEGPAWLVTQKASAWPRHSGKGCSGGGLGRRQQVSKAKTCYLENVGGEDVSVFTQILEFSKEKTFERKGT